MLKILNASPGFGMPLSEQDLEEFLTSKVLNLHLGTVDEKGHANVHPVGYYFDHLKNMFYILTAKESKKTHNLRNETVYFCVDDPNPPYKGVRGKGTARMLEEVKFNLGIWEKIMARYIGNLEDPMAIALKGELKKGDSIVLEISPKYFSTWDYSKQ